MTSDIQTKRRKVGIIGAMTSEMDAIKAKVQDPQIRSISGIEFVEGTIHGLPVVVATSGIGKVFAAMCAQTMILAYQPALVINVGVAGSLSPQLNIGDIAVGASVVQHDIDTTGIGDPLGLISGLNLIWLPSDAHTVKGLQQSAAMLGYHCQTGTIASGDVFVQDRERKARIARTFEAIACEMEGGSIGQVCYVNRVPFCILRAISDNGDESATDDYSLSLDMAADRATQVMDGYLRTLSSLGGPEQAGAWG